MKKDKQKKTFRCCACGEERDDYPGRNAGEGCDCEGPEYNELYDDSWGDYETGNFC